MSETKLTPVSRWRSHRRPPILRRVVRSFLRENFRDAAHFAKFCAQGHLCSRATAYRIYGEAGEGADPSAHVLYHLQESAPEAWARARERAA